MNAVIIDALAFLATLGGFTALLLAMPRHHQDWLGRKLPPIEGRSVRLAGFGLLAVGTAFACAGHGWGYGLVLAIGSWTVSAAVVVAANCNRARILKLWKGTL